ncbi:MAG: bacterioferritin [Xanthomonadales bacterium]|nr:bacterioferritin [Xanthomonadales bacterium]NIX12177.1 bacterioferritin [Xanthomonadales bacterium]
MYICICNSVTDSEIRRAVDGGVRNLRQLKQETGCATGCGRCLEFARQELSDALAERRPLPILAVSPAPA